jgi:hypothetical protein
MIEALIAGETDPNALAALAHRRIKASPAELEAALRGRVTRHHRFLLGLHLQQIDAIDAAIDQIDPEVDALVEPFRTAVQLLTTIPGIDELSACVILAEIGHDMSRFPTAGHLISWAGLCPKNDQSAGKRRSTRMRKGAPWLKTTLVQCAWAAARKKASYLQAQFHRLRSRRLGKKGDWCCRRFDPDGCLSHVEEWNPLRGPWAPITSTNGLKAGKSTASSIAYGTSDLPFKSPLSRPPPNDRENPSTAVTASAPESETARRRPGRRGPAGQFRSRLAGSAPRRLLDRRSRTETLGRPRLCQKCRVQLPTARRGKLFSSVLSPASIAAGMCAETRSAAAIRARSSWWIY